MQYLINNAGEILHGIVKVRSDFLSLHIGQAESQNKCQNHCRKSIQQWGKSNAEVSGNGIIRSLCNLIQSVRRHKAGEQVAGYHIGCCSGNQSGAVCDTNGNKEELPCSLRQIRNSHGNVSKNHQRNNEL